MSDTAETWAWSQPIDLTAKVVLVWFAKLEHAGIVRASAADIARHAGMNIRVAQRSAERLQCMGLIIRESRGVYVLEAYPEYASSVLRVVSAKDVPKRAKRTQSTSQAYSASLPPWHFRLNAHPWPADQALKPDQVRSIQRYAEGLGVDIDQTADEFADYWQRPGEKFRAKWNLAMSLRTWIRHAHEYKQRDQQRGKLERNSAVRGGFAVYDWDPNKDPFGGAQGGRGAN